MDQAWMGVGIITLFFLAGWQIGWKRILGIVPNLAFEQLSGLLQDAFMVERIDKTVPPADFSTQLRDTTGSVIYHRSMGGTLHETLDINVPGMAGMVLHFTAGHLVEFKRIGGTTHRPPGLQSEQVQYVNDLLERVRALAT